MNKETIEMKEQVQEQNQNQLDENISEEKEKKIRKNLYIKAVLSNVATIANTQIGVSVLQTPYVFSHLGLIPSTILIIAFAIFSILGMHGINTVASYTLSRNVRECLFQIVPRKVANVFDILTIFEQQSFLISYITVCSSYFQICLKAWCNVDFDVRYIKVILLPVVILITVFGQPKVLSTIGSFAIVFVLFTVFSVFGTFIKALEDGYVINENEVQQPLPDIEDLLYPMKMKPAASALDIISKIPLFLPLFAAITPQPLLNADLNDDQSIWSIKESNQILNKAAISATCISGSCCYILAISGLLLFGHSTQDNILLNYPPSSKLLTACRFVYGLVIICTYGVIVFPPRRMIMGYIKFKSEKSEKIWFHVIGISMCCFSVLISILVPSISKILGIFCSIFSVGIRFEFPLFFLVLKEKIMSKSKYLPYEDLTRKQAREIVQKQEDQQNQEDQHHQSISVSVSQRPSLIQARQQSFLQQVLRQSFALTHEKQYIDIKQEERKELQRQIFNQDRQFSLATEQQQQQQNDKDRPASIAINRPAHVNDVAAEIQQLNSRPIITQSTTTKITLAQTTEDYQNGEEVEESDTQIKAVQVDKIEERRQYLANYRSKGCFVITWIIAILFLLVNYTAFACQFIDISSLNQ